MNNKQSIFIEASALREDLSIIYKDVSSLKQYLRNNPKELYATPQLIDEENPKSIIILRAVNGHKESLITMINPQILSRVDKIAVEETQSQIEGSYINIRHPKITVAYVSLPKITSVCITLQGKAALLFQQAYSLLQGIPISFLGMRIDNYEEYQKGTPEEKQKLIGDYIASLKTIFEESKKDREVSDYLKATEFVGDKIQRSVNEEIEEAEASGVEPGELPIGEEGVLSSEQPK